jgi:phosphatidate cytidylyltransferase
MSRSSARVLTGITLATVALALLLLGGRFPPGRLALGVVTALALACAWELQRMGSLRGASLGWPLALGALVLCLVEAAGLTRGFGPLQRMTCHYAVSAVVATLLPGKPAAPRAPPWAAVAFSVWLLPPLFALVVVEQTFGLAALTVLVVLAKIGDNAGYFAGRALGKHHPFPRLSPGKTVEGCVASLVTGILAGAVLLPLTLGGRTPSQVALGALLGGTINAAAQAGDLSKSWVKRRAGVKDSSSLLGPAGGVLDVIDSLLLAAPVALIGWSWAYGAEGPIP